MHSFDGDSIAVSIDSHKGEIRLQHFLTAGPGHIAEAARYCRDIACSAYRIGPNSTLLRQGTAMAKGGLLVVSDRNAPPVHRPDALCAAILRECGRQQFQGAVLDFEETPQQDLFAFAKQLEQTLSSTKKALYLTENYAAVGGQSILLLCSAISGGNYTQHLRRAATRRGDVCRMALDVQRLRMDFTLPCLSGEGKTLTAEELHRLTEQERPSVFFSPDLCTRYFTYARDGTAHFVLFDDADTINQKVKIAASLGYAAAFFLWPEVCDIAKGIVFR